MSLLKFQPLYFIIIVYRNKKTIFVAFHWKKQLLCSQLNSVIINPLKYLGEIRIVLRSTTIYISRFSSYACGKWLLASSRVCLYVRSRVGEGDCLEEGEPSNSILISINVIVTNGGRYKLPKHVVEDKWMHSIYSVVFILIIKTDIHIYIKCLKSAFFDTEVRSLQISSLGWSILMKGLFVLFTFSDPSQVDPSLR